MTISRTQRFIGYLINGITFNGLIIGNLILLLTAGKTVGGLVAGYKYEKGGAGVIALWATQILEGILTGITFGLFWIFDIITMEKRDGMFYEKWANNRKVSN